MSTIRVSREPVRVHLVNGPAYSDDRKLAYPRRETGRVWVSGTGWRGSNLFVLGSTAFATLAEARAQADANYAAMSSTEFQAWQAEQDRIANERAERNRAAMQKELAEA